MSNIKRLGKQTVRFDTPPRIIDSACTVGPKEGEGPLARTFDKVVPNLYYGEKSFEKAERKFVENNINLLLDKQALKPQDIDFLLAGDLLNQLISSNFAAGSLGIPFLGIFGACSTMAEGLILGSMLIDGGFASKIVTSASSHYGTAERQYRGPLEQGVQRPLTSQWTVTGAGAFLLAGEGQGINITHATVGKAIDAGVKDVNEMGAAMAPAAVDTIVTHLEDTGRQAADYDLIITGDLAAVGRNISVDLARHRGYDLTGLNDCGILIFDPETQDTHAGGSGCACSAVVTAGHLIQEMKAGKYNRILIVGTGALMSVTSSQQGEAIPGIGHGIVLENQNHPG